MEPILLGKKCLTMYGIFNPSNIYLRKKDTLCHSLKSLKSNKVTLKNPIFLSVYKRKKSQYMNFRTDLEFQNRLTNKILNVSYEILNYAWIYQKQMDFFSRQNSHEFKQKAWKLVFIDELYVVLLRYIPVLGVRKW